MQDDTILYQKIMSFWWEKKQFIHQTAPYDAILTKIQFVGARRRHLDEKIPYFWREKESFGT